jgi:hypothetical protein
MHPYCHAQRPHVEGSKQCEMMAPEATQAPPAWLTADVLAALPADGTPRGFNAIEHLVNMERSGDHVARMGAIHDALAHLVSTGEIEATPERWRRWGVPEGWAWRERDGWVDLYRVGADESYQIASVHTDGGWTVFESEQSVRVAAEGTSKPPTLAAARTAALRACYERGVFAPAALPKPAPPPQPEDRPARLRAALLAVLTPGPVRTTAALLPALDAAMGERAGVAVATGAEARRAAAEIGARVDGVEWSLPAVPDGWGWRLDNELGISFLLRESVPTSDINTLVDQAIARADEDTGEWMIWLPGADAWTTGGNMLPLESAQAAALAAARLAGLFAAPRAEAATGAAPAPKAPAHASDASAIPATRPL